jgi:NADPH2:quinone reductase
MMQAIVCEELGAELRFGEIDEPAAPDGDKVRIRVSAASVNFPDLLMIAGTYQYKPVLPFVPGLEAAGTVIECGRDVTTLKPGDRVIALVDQGAFAEQLVAGSQGVLKIPDAMPFEIAAGFSVAYLSAWYGLIERCRLAAGETLLVLGAAGGIGLAAVEIGTAVGARIIAAARGADKLALCRQHGAADTIDYESEDLSDRVKQITDGKGADVIFDPVGGEMADAALRCIARRGRIAVVGFAAGQIQKIPANYLLLKDCDAVGVNGSSFVKHSHSRAVLAFEKLTSLYLARQLRPHVSHCMPLAKAKDALRLLGERNSTGKIVPLLEERETR